MILTLSDELKPTTSVVLMQLGIRIGAVLPGVEVHHIGSTAIPGVLTKGDLDVLLRVEAQDFPSVVATLRGQFTVKQPENWRADFASFGSDTDFAIPVGVQVVIKESEVDFFLFVRDHLIANPDALALYNQAKLESWAQNPHEYWASKNRVLTQILALKR